MSERDNILIAEFNDRRCETAFAALVRQHVDLVFGTALRQVGDRGAAEEIAQNVFVALAQSSGKLGSHPTIAGWLHQTTLNKSREWLRSELRRRHREQTAVELELAGAEGDSVWSSLIPLLDEALLELRESDRLAVILHFMEGQTFGEVGSVLGVGEDTARKRVSKCLDQLTNFFRKRGATPALFAGAPLFALSSHVAPPGLAASATASGLAAHSAASTLTLIKGALKLMAWAKTKTAIVAGTVALLTIGATTTAVVVHHSHSRKTQIVNRSFPRDSWAFLGYADPESAFASTAWAMSQGEVKTYVNSLVPGGEFFRDTQNKSGAQIAAKTGEDMKGVTGFEVVSKEIISADEVILGIHADGINQDVRIQLKRLDGDWKVVGKDASGQNQSKAPRLQLDPNRPRQ